MPAVSLDQPDHPDMGEKMDQLSPFHWLIVLVPLGVAFGFPIAKILQRLGISRWWTILAFFPLLNVLGLWALSAVRSPKVDVGVN